MVSRGDFTGRVSHQSSAAARGTIVDTAFKQVDVFTLARFQGNPVAVVMQADGLSTRLMRQIANWTNLSETTFVLPPTRPEADYRVRIFTPKAELPFAGHPTIGTAHALLEAGRIKPSNGSLVQECGAGLVRLEVTAGSDGGQWIAFDLPEPNFSALSAAQVQEIADLLGTAVVHEPAPQVIDVGPRWIVVQLPSARAVLAAAPDFARMKTHNAREHCTGIVIFGPHENSEAAAIEVRAFAPAHGIDEDPVCGSGNGCVAAFIRNARQTDQFGSRFLASQGAVVGRAGWLRLAVSDSRIQVGGNAVTCIDGRISI